MAYGRDDWSNLVIRGHNSNHNACRVSSSSASRSLCNQVMWPSVGAQLLLQEAPGDSITPLPGRAVCQPISGASCLFCCRFQDILCRSLFLTPTQLPLNFRFIFGAVTYHLWHRAWLELGFGSRMHDWSGFGDRIASLGFTLNECSGDTWLCMCWEDRSLLYLWCCWICNNAAVSPISVCSRPPLLVFWGQYPLSGLSLFRITIETVLRHMFSPSLWSRVWYWSVSLNMSNQIEINVDSIIKQLLSVRDTPGKQVIIGIMSYKWWFAMLSLHYTIFVTSLNHAQHLQMC